MLVSEVTFPSPMGEWRVATAPPAGDLSDFAFSYWESGGHVGYGYEKLVPKGSADLIFNLAGPQALYPEGNIGQQRIYNRAWVCGLFDKPLYVGPAYDAGVMGTHLVAVQIKPSAIYALFGVKASELVNQVVEAVDFFGVEVDHVWNRICNAVATEERFSHIEDFLRDCLTRLARPAPFGALWAAQQMHASHGQMRIAELCADLSVSRKHLNHLFKETIGLTPKSYARLIRFRAAIERLHGLNRPSFAELALELGFADQAHFINDFNAFAGESPTSFLSNRSSDGESVLYD